FVIWWTSGLRSRSSRSVCPAETGIPPLHVEDVDRPIAVAELGQTVPDRLGGGGRRPARRLLQGKPAGEQRRERRGVRAPGAVGRRHLVLLDGDVHVTLAVEQVVGGLAAVAAGDDHRRGPEPSQHLCQFVTRPGTWSLGAAR